MNFLDQLNRTVELSSFPPRKIISLVPSQTELLFDLGLDKEVIGITKFCVHPNEWFRSKKRIGGTKQLNLSLIRELQPHLIIANKEENQQSQIEELEKEFSVWISDIKNLEGAYDMIRKVGELVGKQNESNRLVTKIQQVFSQYQFTLNNEQSTSKLRTVYLIWKDPYMTVGGDTFINDMLERCGLINIFKNLSRYPQLQLDQLSSANCQLCLLSSEPYPFKQKHVEQLQQHLPETKIMLVDGEMFSWYGSRLQNVPQYFKQLRELVFNR